MLSKLQKYCFGPSYADYFKAGRNSIFAQALIEKYGVQIKEKFENETLDDDCLKNLQKEMTVEMTNVFEVSWFGKRNLKKHNERNSLSKILYWAAICKSGYFLQTTIPPDLCVDAVGAGLCVFRGVGIGTEASEAAPGSAVPAASVRAEYLSSRMGRLLVVEVVGLLTQKPVGRIVDEDLTQILRNVKVSMDAGNGRIDSGGGGGGADREDGGKREGSCAICCESLSGDCTSSPCDQCGLVLHEVCLLTWREISNTCPLCRRKF